MCRPLAIVSYKNYHVCFNLTIVQLRHQRGEIASARQQKTVECSFLKERLGMSLSEKAFSLSLYTCSCWNGS